MVQKLKVRAAAVPVYIIERQMWSRKGAWRASSHVESTPMNRQAQAQQSSTYPAGDLTLTMTVAPHRSQQRSPVRAFNNIRNLMSAGPAARG